MCVLKDVQRDTSDQTALSNQESELGKAEILSKLVSRLDGGGVLLLK
jgi:hypothetical protein